MKERELIAAINSLVGSNIKGVRKGIGDDCAVIEKNREKVWLVTMDTLIESVHFDLSFHPPEKLGRKCISVNVSDIAAMGGRPLFVFLSLGLVSGFAENWFERFSRSLIDACEYYGCVLIGGDTVRSSDSFVFTLTLIGEADAKKVVYRCGAKPGDIIWISGHLGLAAAGLELCRKEKGQLDYDFQVLVDAHLDPKVNAELGYILAQSGLVNSMIDLSDGLATDLAHLCKESGVGACIEAEKLPLHPALKKASEKLDFNYLELMLSGGEDYKLLFTAPITATEKLERLAVRHNLTLYPVGTIEYQSGVKLARKDYKSDKLIKEHIDYQGFDHFV